MGQYIQNGKKKSGFTLIEILIAIVIIGIVATTVRPSYQKAIIKSKESALKKNLYIMRDALDVYCIDHKNSEGINVYPESLEDLVSEKYIRYLPIDPITENSDWELVYDENEEGIFDIKSSSKEESSDGRIYNEW